MFGAEGHQRLSNRPVYLNIIRGQPEKPPVRGGIGVLAYYPERPPSPDEFDDRMDESVGGYFWLPEAAYDEVWQQARVSCDECVIELDFEPTESAGGGLRWNTVENKVASITSAGVRFERKLKPPVENPRRAPLPELSKKRGFFSGR